MRRRKHAGGNRAKIRGEDLKLFCFLHFVRRYLAPKLQPGDVVALDNLRSHKVPGVRAALEAVGAQVMYLPPYSPDLNPIEPAWAKMKGLLRKASAATEALLRTAIGAASRRIRSSDIAGWFAHCGYLSRPPMSVG